MIIRSQDKKTIVPIEHGYITLSNYNNRSQIIFSVINENDAYLALGSYSTDEKAIKVLDMIQQTYLSSVDWLNIKNSSNVLQMPADEELDEPTSQTIIDDVNKFHEVTETEKELADALNSVKNYKNLLFGN